MTRIPHFISNLLHIHAPQAQALGQKSQQRLPYQSWSGFAFEKLCLAHIAHIKHALGISGIYTEESAWRKIGTAQEEGAQVDLVINRGDNVVNLCEIKFSNTPYLITKYYAEKLRQKQFLFTSDTKLKKSIFWAFITTFGVVENEYSNSLVQKSLDISIFFKEIEQ